MNTFVLHLQSATQYERIESVVSFVGEDDSGSFGILAGHARMMTSLVFGLARFRTSGAGWEFLALPGALLYFVGNQLYVNTRRYLRDADYQRIAIQLQEQLLKEEATLHDVKKSLRRLEEEMFKRLWRVQRGGETPL
ncbi:MAG: F0F1 ATP synthase subunit epsilon [Pseudomonadota bacterium]